MKQKSIKIIQAVSVAFLGLLGFTPRAQAGFIKVEKIYVAGKPEQQQHHIFGSSIKRILDSTRKHPSNSKNRQHNTKLAQQFLSKARQAGGLVRSAQAKRLLSNLEKALNRIIARAKQQPMKNFWDGIDGPLNQLLATRAVATRVPATRAVAVCPVQTTDRPSRQAPLGLPAPGRARATRPIFGLPAPGEAPVASEPARGLPAPGEAPVAPEPARGLPAPGGM